MFYAIDRMEGELVVVEDDDGNTRDLPRAAIPADARQGDVLVPDGDGYRVDTEETARRRAYILQLQERLRQR